MPMIELIDLTDEELAALDTQPAASRLVVYPYLDGLDDHDRDVAIVAALRSLVCRGHVELRSAEPNQMVASGDAKPAQDALHIEDALRHLLGLRRSARRVVCLQRTVNDRTDFRYIYLLDDGVTLSEDVQAPGFHHFELSDDSQLVEALAHYVNPWARSGRSGTAVTIDPGAAGHHAQDVVERLGPLDSFSELFAREPDTPEERPTLLGVFTSGAGLFMSETRFDSGEPATIVPVTTDTLAQRIRSAIYG